MDSFFSYIEQNKETISRSLYTGLNHEPPQVYRQVKLIKQDLPNRSIQESIEQRHSVIDFDSSTSLHIEELSLLLQHAYGRRDDGKRTFPSAGNFYPQSLFAIVLHVSGLTEGIYEYDVQTHALNLIDKTVPENTVLMEGFINEKFTRASVLLCFTLHKGKNMEKYGSYIYPHSFLEAGHVGQNIYLVAAALGLDCCAMGTARYSVVNELLGLSGTANNYIYGIALGSKTPDL